MVSRASAIGQYLLVSILAIVPSIAQAQKPHQNAPAPPISEAEAVAQFTRLRAKFDRNSNGEITGIHLLGNPITNDSLTYLKAFPHLDTVEIHCAPNVTDDGLLAFETLPGLKVLWLRAANITDQGMVHLRNLSGLTDLIVDGYMAEFKGDGIADLKALKGLRSLEFGLLANMPDEAVDELRKELPNCHIVSPKFRKPRR